MYRLQLSRVKITLSVLRKRHVPELLRLFCTGLFVHRYRRDVYFRGDFIRVRGEQQSMYRRFFVHKFQYQRLFFVLSRIFSRAPPRGC